MKNIEPSNPCFLFIKPKIKPEIKNKSKEIISIINGATFTPLNCINEIINDVIDVNTIKHAYAMSIHKSQGSEFNHVIIPVTKEYTRMLYNKLIYTGVSRAKKSLVLIGDVDAFNYAVKNSYSIERKTSLMEFITNKYR